MRRGTLLLVGVVLAGVTLVSPSAEASVKVLGSGFGRLCYEYAKAGHASDSGVETCNKALAERSLTPEDRALNPSLAEAYINKGVALVNLGRDAEAVAAISEALKLNTEQPEIAYYTRGVAHEILGNMRAAYSDYRQAAALKPDWQEPQTQLMRFSVVPKGRG